MYTENLILLEVLVVPRGLKKNELFSQETYNSQNFRYETLKSPLLKNQVCPSYLVSCESHRRLKVHFVIFTDHRMNEYELIYD